MTARRPVKPFPLGEELMTVGEKTAAAKLHEPLFQPHLLVSALRYDLKRPLLHLDDGKTITVGEFAELTSQYVQAFGACGLLPGARIAILTENRTYR